MDDEELSDAEKELKAVGCVLTDEDRQMEYLTWISSCTNNEIEQLQKDREMKERIAIARLRHLR